MARQSSTFPKDIRANFRRYLHQLKRRVPYLLDFAEWLEYELQIQEGGDAFDRIETNKKAAKWQRDHRKDGKGGNRQWLCSWALPKLLFPKHLLQQCPLHSYLRSPDCTVLTNNLHNLGDYFNFSHLTKQQKKQWVTNNGHCWRCGHSHQAAQCHLRFICGTCKGKHLNALRNVNTKTEEQSKGEKPSAETICGFVNSTDILYLDYF